MRIHPPKGSLPPSLAAVALSLCLALLAATPAVAAPVGGGHLDWGLKESFRNYINGPTAHGQVTLSGGASQNDDGTYRFPAASGEGDADGADVRFAGSVRFTGHDSGAGPLLDLTVADIRVVLDGAGPAGTVYADVASKSLGTGEIERFEDVDLADLDPTGIEPVAAGETLTWTGVPAVLTEDGAQAFAGFYTAGTAMDPVTVLADFTPGGEPEVPGGSGDPAQPGGGQPARSGDSGPPSPPPAGAPPQPSPRVVPQPARATAGPAGVAVVARASCPGAVPCLLRVPRRVKVKVDGTVYWARVIAPRAIEAGGRARVRVKLPRRAIAALDGRRAKVRVRVLVRSAGDGRKLARRTATVAVKAG